jgi:hypothetical protein
MVTENTQSICEYKVVFSLVYYDAYGFPIVSGSLTSDILYATNSVLQHEDTQDLNLYILPDSLVGGSFGYEFSNDFDVE